MLIFFYFWRQLQEAVTYGSIHRRSSVNFLKLADVDYGDARMTSDTCVETSWLRLGIS
jgi:hypothetical protein